MEMNTSKTIIGLVFLSIFLLGCSASSSNITHTKLINSLPDILIVDEFKLNIPVEEDLRFPPNVIKVAANFPPDTNLYSLDFSNTRNEYAYIVAQMPHSRADDTNLSAHFHWQTQNNNAGDVVWALDYSCASINEAFPSFVKGTVVDSSINDSTKHLMSNEIVIPATNLGISAICKIKIYRDTEDVRDTYIGDAMLLEFDIHYYLDKLGENRGDTNE